jgi:hypothetical protein
MYSNCTPSSVKLLPSWLTSTLTCPADPAGVVHLSIVDDSQRLGISDELPNRQLSCSVGSKLLPYTCTCSMPCMSPLLGTTRTTVLCVRHVSITELDEKATPSLLASTASIVPGVCGGAVHTSSVEEATTASASVLPKRQIDEAPKPRPTTLIALPPWAGLYDGITA